MTDHDRTARDGAADARESSRRRVLAAAGVSLSAALASAGCLSNPWGPSSPGAGGATDAADDGTAPGTATAAGDGSATTADDDGTAAGDETAAGDGTATADGDGFRFVPETFTVEAGDTVHWEWRDGGHNVRVREQPADADWTGTPGGV